MPRFSVGTIGDCTFPRWNFYIFRSLLSAIVFKSGFQFYPSLSREGLQIYSCKVFALIVHNFSYALYIPLSLPSRSEQAFIIHRLVRAPFHEGPPPFIFPDNPFTRLCIWYLSPSSLSLFRSYLDVSFE